MSMSPRLTRLFFLHDSPPPCPLSFDSTFSLSLSTLSSSSWALTYYVVAIATYLDAPSPLLLRCRLYRHIAATIVTPMPVSLRLSRASGWLLHRHLSRRDILADRRRITTFFGGGKSLNKLICVTSRQGICDERDILTCVNSQM